MNSHPVRKPISWLPVVHALMSAGLWTLAYDNFIGGAFQTAVDFLAGPTAVVGLVVGIVALARRRPPRALAVVGVLLSVAALAFIAFGFLRILAMAGFA